MTIPRTGETLGRRFHRHRRRPRSGSADSTLSAGKPALSTDDGMIPSGDAPCGPTTILRPVPPWHLDPDPWLHSSQITGRGNSGWGLDMLTINEGTRRDACMNNAYWPWPPGGLVAITPPTHASGPRARTVRLTCGALGGSCGASGVRHQCRVALGMSAGHDYEVVSSGDRPVGGGEELRRPKSRSMAALAYRIVPPFRRDRHRTCATVTRAIGSKGEP